MMSPSARPNFFLLLELNPDEKWDQIIYQNALQEKIRQWNRDSMGVAKKALPAQANRALLPQIRQVMENSALREKEAEEARKIFAERYQAAHVQFERQLALLNMKEQVEAEEIDHFVEEFKYLLSAEAIRKRITVKAQRAAERNGRALRTLDTSMVKNIAERLEIIHVKTLYEFLLCTPKSTAAVLFQAAKELYEREVRRHPTAEVTVRIELAGFAMDIFKTDEMRARYDETLRLMVIQQLLKELEDSIRRSSKKELHPRQVLYFLKNAAIAGWREKEALERLKEHARTHQWFVMMPTKEGEPLISPADTVLHNYQQPVSLVKTPTSIENIQNLQYHILQTAIRLYWKWPIGCKAAYVSYLNKPGVLQHHTPPAITHYISRIEYERLGYYDIYGVSNQHYNILISAIGEQNGVQVVASGICIHLHLHKMVLTYELRLPHFLQRKRMLNIIADATGPIPSLILVSRSHELPLQKTDGDLFYHMEGKMNKEGAMNIVLPATPLPPETFGKLFLEDDRLYNTIVIHHPAREQLRLS